MRDQSSLEQGLAGDVVGPDDAGWTAARAAWNLAADQHPALVVMAAGPQDVAATLGYAAEHGLRVAPQGTGHGAPSLEALDETILLRTTRLGGVEIDSSARTARVGAGAVWDDVVGPAAKHGLAALHGFSGGVGVAGYTLGGGLGWLGRSRGLAANAVTGLDVVLTDGRALRVDDQREPELFWALRGGGGLGAVVTALELELFPLSEAYAGHIAWPLEQAPEVVDAYRSWTNDLPEELTSTIRLMHYPPAPELPPELRGHAFALVTLIFDGGADMEHSSWLPCAVWAHPRPTRSRRLPEISCRRSRATPRDPSPASAAACSCANSIRRPISRSAVPVCGRRWRTWSTATSVAPWRGPPRVKEPPVRLTRSSSSMR